MGRIKDPGNKGKFLEFTGSGNLLQKVRENSLRLGIYFNCTKITFRIPLHIMGVRNCLEFLQSKRSLVEFITFSAIERK